MLVCKHSITQKRIDSNWRRKEALCAKPMKSRVFLAFPAFVMAGLTESVSDQPPLPAVSEKYFSSLPVSPSRSS
jgi:hypothetical protein